MENDCASRLAYLLFILNEFYLLRVNIIDSTFFFSFDANYQDKKRAFPFQIKFTVVGFSLYLFIFLFILLL